jgi:hypothetical protein
LHAPHILLLLDGCTAPERHYYSPSPQSGAMAKPKFAKIPANAAWLGSDLLFRCHFKDQLTATHHLVVRNV